MPSYKMVDLDCKTCGPGEALIERGSERAECPGCGDHAPIVMSAPLVQTVNQRNSDFGERQKERLDRRAHEHFVTKGKDEAHHRTEVAMKGATGG